MTELKAKTETAKAEFLQKFGGNIAKIPTKNLNSKGEIVVKQTVEQIT